MSERLVDRGLARAARQSCLAGPSVYATLYDPRRFERLYPLSRIKGTKMCTAAAWNTRAAADACALSTACYRIAAIVDASDVHAPVTPLVWSIVRGSPRGCKGFCVVSSRVRKRNRGLRACDAFHSWKSHLVRGVQARPARPATVHSPASRGSPAPRHAERILQCRAGHGRATTRDRPWQRPPGSAASAGNPFPAPPCR
jgi:hypothetical protein